MRLNGTRVSVIRSLGKCRYAMVDRAGHTASISGHTQSQSAADREASSIAATRFEADCLIASRRHLSNPRYSISTDGLTLGPSETAIFIVWSCGAICARSRLDCIVQIPL